MGRSQPRSNPALEKRLILDSGAVIALSRQDHRALAFLRDARKRGVDIQIPVIVVAETSRGSGPRNARVNRVLKMIDKVPLATEEIGRLAGGLLANASSSATVDAMIVAQAVASGGARILTSDPGDLTALARDCPEVGIQSL